MEEYIPKIEIPKDDFDLERDIITISTRFLITEIYDFLD